LDKIEALDKRRPLSKEKKMGLLLEAVIDAKFRQTVIQLCSEIKQKAITSCKFRVAHGGDSSGDR
jgi:hypothetical protein